MTLSCNNSVSLCPISGKYISLGSPGQGESNGVIFIEFQLLGEEISSFKDGHENFKACF